MVYLWTLPAATLQRNMRFQFVCSLRQNLPQLSEVTGKRVHLLLPDEVEYKRAADM